MMALVRKGDISYSFRNFACSKLPAVLCSAIFSLGLLSVTFTPNALADPIGDDYIVFLDFVVDGPLEKHAASAIFGLPNPEPLPAIGPGLGPHPGKELLIEEELDVDILKFWIEAEDGGDLYEGTIDSDTVFLTLLDLDWGSTFTDSVTVEDLKVIVTFPDAPDILIDFLLLENSVFIDGDGTEAVPLDLSFVLAGENFEAFGPFGFNKASDLHVEFRVEHGNGEVPEPGEMVLLSVALLGMIGMIGMWRRRRAV